MPKRLVVFWGMIHVFAVFNIQAGAVGFRKTPCEEPWDFREKALKELKGCLDEFAKSEIPLKTSATKESAQICAAELKNFIKAVTDYRSCAKIN